MSEHPSQPSSSPATKAVTQIGAPAPDFKLPKLDGPDFLLSAQKGRVIVLEFGCLSSPVFRDRMAAMQRLARQTELRADFIIIYTREAHPVGGWTLERNKAAGIEVDQPADLLARRALARKAHDLLNITIPIAIDSMDDQVAREYDGLPNAAIIIGRDQHIAARQQWTDPSGLLRLIDQAASITNPAR